MMGKARNALRGQIPFRLAVQTRGEQSVFRRLKDLRRLEREPVDSVLKHQRQRLAGMLNYALTRVPYYRDSAGRHPLEPQNAAEYLRRLPILEKEVIQEQPERLLADGWVGRFTTKTTGGSTGRPVTVRKNSEAIAQEMAATWLGYGWYGVRVGDPCVRFWGQPPRNLKRRLRYMAADLATHRKTLSAFGYTRGDLGEYVATIDRFRPAYLYGYVSVLEDLARYLLEKDRRLSGEYLKSVVTTSEVLSSPQRAVIAEAFGVPVQNEYGCGELGPIAYECKEGSLHLLPTNQYLEIVDDEGRAVPAGEPGHIVLTDLTNRVMPLIRYRIGDMGRSAGPCSCGRPFPVLGEVFGREYDFVEAPDGRRFHGEFFMYAFEDLRQKHPEIGQFQVVQTTKTELVVRVVRSGSSGTDTLDGIRIELERRLPGFRLSIDWVPRLERRPSGKMRVVENRVHG